MLAILEGKLMNDYVDEKVYDGVKKTTRIFHLHQKDSNSRELVEIKDVDFSVKAELGKEISILCEIRPWRNDRGQSGISIKQFQ